MHSFDTRTRLQECVTRLLDRVHAQVDDRFPRGAELVVDIHTDAKSDEERCGYYFVYDMNEYRSVFWDEEIELAAVAPQPEPKLYSDVYVGKTRSC